MCHSVSQELWKLIDDHQRQDFTEAATERIIPPPSPEAIAAASAHERIEQKIRAMNTHPAPRAKDCRCTFIRLRRPLEGGGVEEALFRPACGRSSCGECLRRRIIRTLTRASETLLDAHAARLGGVGRVPRVEPLHVAEVDWSKWAATDKAIRRRYPDCVDARGRCNVGRLRVRKKGGRTLVVCEKPFGGSRPISPPEALDLVSAAVDDLDLERREYPRDRNKPDDCEKGHSTGMHSYRQMGRWAQERPKRWELKKKSVEPFDFDLIQKELSRHEVRVKRFQRSAMVGLLWRVDSAEAAERLWAACPSLSNPGNKKQQKTDSDTGAVEIPGEWQPDYDPAANRYG